MLEVYQKILELFDSGERRRFYALMVLMVLVTFAEALSIATILPLLSVLAQPEMVMSNRALYWAYETFGSNDMTKFQVVLSGAVFAAVLGGLLLKAMGTYAMTRFAMMRGYTISSRLLQAYLHQPYSWFLQRNSASVGKSVLAEVNELMVRILLPGVTLLANLMLAITIVLLLIVIDPFVAVSAALLIGGSYTLIFLRIRKLLKKLGREQLQANDERFRLAQEATSGIKEVKLMGLEDIYIQRFNDPARRIARLAALNQILGQLPRFLLEALAFGTMLGLVLVLLIRNSGDLAAVIPILGIITFAVMRLLPAMQQVYRGVTSIQGAKAVLDHIYADYTSATQERNKTIQESGSDRVCLDHSLELSAIRYVYSSAERAAVQELDLVISAGSTVGIVGGTGAGKTTLVDLILGLLSPQSGEMRVDGSAVTAVNLRAWQKSLGYVPQNIYLIDSTIACNIAFGVPTDQIDMVAVERAARIAALHDFVVTELPESYETMVGERGVRLSGGQRQRIGIARALYHDPSLLILDEATSALDNLTERVVMEAVQNIAGAKTIIMIAHRLSTVKNCDVIFVMQKGCIVARGRYDELLESSALFRRMATLG